jgi:hypothetical protein
MIEIFAIFIKNVRDNKLVHFIYIHLKIILIN